MSPRKCKTETAEVDSPTPPTAGDGTAAETPGDSDGNVLPEQPGGSEPVDAGTGGAGSGDRGDE
ncbi:MAG: hypothetical protein J7L61_01910, partial [Thermoplasmata archaeon]|nr:hypothetical protein [Thermoplasmata archaeon]